MEPRIEEEIPLNAPSLTKHLFPLDPRIDPDLERINAQRAFSGFWQAPPF